MTEGSINDARRAAKSRLTAFSERFYVHVSAKQAQRVAVAQEPLFQQQHNFMPCLQKHHAMNVPRTTEDAAAMIGAVASDERNNFAIISPGHYPWNAAIIEQDRRHRQHEGWREEQYLLHQRRYRSLVPRLACRSRKLRGMRQWYIAYELASGDRKAEILGHEQVDLDSNEVATEETESSENELEQSSQETKIKPAASDEDDDLNTPVVPGSAQSYSWLRALEQCAVQ